MCNSTHLDLVGLVVLGRLTKRQILIANLNFYLGLKYSSIFGVYDDDGP